MTKSLPEDLRADVTDLASAKAWIEALHRHDLVFHFDDDPGGDAWIGAAGKGAFADADVPLIRDRVAKLNALDWGELEDAHDYSCSLSTHEDMPPRIKYTPEHSARLGEMAEAARAAGPKKKP